MKDKLSKYVDIILWVGILIYGGLCFYLFYMQSIQPLDYNNRYFQSDLPYHISMIIDDGWYYSFTAYLYQLLYWLGGNGTVLIALFLAAASVLCVVLTGRLVASLLGKKGMDTFSLGTGTFSLGTDTFSLGCALALNLVMPFFWRYAGEYRYVSYQAGNIWHNSTYQCMKPVALAAILCYLKVEEGYRERLNSRQWLAMAGLLVLCTGIKPSFLTVFAPVLAVKLLADLGRKVPFKQIFLLGSTVLPACVVILWQNTVLFGADTGQGITLSPWYTFSLHANKTKLAVLCSAAFPLVILLFSVRELLRDRRYLFVWGMAGVGFLEALLLVETGSRSRDGNFLWGYCIALFLIFVFSLEKWLFFLKKKEHSLFYRIAFTVSGGVLAYQLFCGIVFFVRLLQGETYFMVG